MQKTFYLPNKTETMFDFSNKIDKVTDFTNKADTNQIRENVRLYLRKSLAYCDLLLNKLLVNGQLRSEYMTGTNCE